MIERGVGGYLGRDGLAGSRGRGGGGGGEAREVGGTKEEGRRGEDLERKEEGKGEGWRGGAII